MTDTPRTEALKSKLWISATPGVTEKWLVDAEECRKMELELNVYKRAAERLAGVLRKAWKHRCSDRIGGCEAVSASARKEALAEYKALKSPHITRPS